MGKPSYIYVYAKAPSTADLRLESPKVEPGTVLEIHSAAVCDLTTENKTLRIGWSDGTHDYWIKREAAGSGVYGITIQGKLILGEGSRLIALIESPTAGDECVLVASGWLVELGSG